MNRKILDIDTAISYALAKKSLAVIFVLTALVSPVYGQSSTIELPDIPDNDFLHPIPLPSNKLCGRLIGGDTRYSDRIYGYTFIANPGEIVVRITVGGVRRSYDMLDVGFMSQDLPSGFHVYLPSRGEASGRVKFNRPQRVHMLISASSSNNEPGTAPFCVELDGSLQLKKVKSGERFELLTVPSS